MFFTLLGDIAAAGRVVVAVTNCPDSLDEASADREVWVRARSITPATSLLGSGQRWPWTVPQ